MSASFLQTAGEQPIPITEAKRATDAAGLVEVDRDSPLYGEALCDLAARGLSAESFYHAADGWNAPYYRAVPGALPKVQCRRSVAEKLGEVDAFLKPLGLALHVWDGYRPLECQRGLWDFFMKEARRRLKGAAEAACREYAARYCADPGRFDPADALTWPPHLTGGAVDLTLKRRSTGELLFMGGIFDDAGEVSHVDHLEKQAAAACAAGDCLLQSATDALKNRRILYHVMLRHGFSNYSYEWWHYDWGNPFWIAHAGEAVRGERPRRAYYGPIVG